ncbi:hypothetical protein [Microbulbifer sp. TYP-18]|uniref:hypothetical protein n=1 Tax=Microbulbifer sp. TYP-18 TaxID=3230024 RepID=UPI0034C61559
MRFIAVFLFLFSAVALANDIKLACTISGKSFGVDETEEYQITFNEKEKRVCTNYPCRRSDTYKAGESITYEGYKNRPTTNTVESWSKEIIEFKSRSKATHTYTLDRTSGILRYVFRGRNFEVKTNMEGPCKVVKKFQNEKELKF